MSIEKASVHNKHFWHLLKTGKKELVKKGSGGAILMDLSKAFDTIKSYLPIAKLYAYGFNKESLKFLHKAKPRWSFGLLAKTHKKNRVGRQNENNIIWFLGSVSF